MGVDEVVENNEETMRRTEHANKYLATHYVPKLAEKKVRTTGMGCIVIYLSPSFEHSCQPFA